MKTVLQRVSEANVKVNGEVIGAIGPGLLVFFCAEPEDNPEKASYFARKVASMRIFPDKSGKMNFSISEIGGAVLVISQFTLIAEWRKGNRPGFSRAADPQTGEAMYGFFCNELRRNGLVVESGRFGAEMEVALVNAGPVTIIMDEQ